MTISLHYQPCYLTLSLNRCPSVWRDFYLAHKNIFCVKNGSIPWENVPSIIGNNFCARMIFTAAVREVLSWSLRVALLRFQTKSLKWRS